MNSTLYENIHLSELLDRAEHRIDELEAQLKGARILLWALCTFYGSLAVPVKLLHEWTPEATVTKREVNQMLILTGGRK